MATTRGGARGIIWALDAKSGHTLWSFDTSVNNLWGNPRTNSGAGLWYPPTFDEVGNMYVGTGNSAPYPGNPAYPNGGSRPGENDYAASMVSIDLATGAVNWAINALPHDLFDHDFQNSPILATVPLNGTDFLLSIGSGKTGTVIAADAKTGAMIWKTAVGKHQNDQLQELPPGTTEVWPSSGVQTPGAFADGKYFAAYRNRPSFLTPTGADATKSVPMTDETGGLAAIDAATGNIVWDVKIPTVMVVGATVANDLVFTGGTDGILRAFEVKTGKAVWQFQAESGMNAPLAIAGDTIFFAATAPFVLHTPDGGTPVPSPTPKFAVYAMKLRS